MKKINFHGDSKVINYIVDCINWFIDNHSVSTLDDVTLTNIADGQILKYDSTTSKFVNADESGGGGSVTPSITKVYDSNASGSSSYTVLKDGLYLIINSYSYNATHSVTLSRTPIISGYIGSDRGMTWDIVNLKKNDVVTMVNTPSSWDAFGKIIYLLENITVDSLSDSEGVDDGTATLTPPSGNYLMVGVAMGRMSNDYSNNTDTTGFNGIKLEDEIGVNTSIGVYYGDDIPEGNFYGYDGGGGYIALFLARNNGGGSGTNVVANPTGTPIDTLTTIGIDGTRTTYYTENSQICSVNGNYVTSNLDTQLVNGGYKIHITDGAYEFDNNFTYSGSTVILELSANGETYIIEITSTTVGMTYGSGAWSDIYCDIYTEESGQVIYDLGTSADKISYDNTTSGLTADDVQEAIDEVQSNVEDMIPLTQKGANGGVAELDSNGKVPSSQLPSYVDDVIEGYYNSNTDRFYKESTFITVIPPEDGKSWVDVTTNKSYRWTGSVYTRVDEGVQLGETSSTAYRGDRGKTAYEHSQMTSGNPHNVSKSDVGLGNVPNVSTNDQTPTFTEASSRTNIASGEKLSVIFGKIMKWFTDLKTVAFTNSYTDLDNKPNIPTVNNATLNIKKNGTSQGTFTANASTDVNIDISVPTKTSDLTNDSGYITTDENVKQTPTSNNANYEVLFSGTADNTEHTEVTRKSSDLLYNPATGNLMSKRVNENYKPQSIGLGFYAENDTHILKIGYFTATSTYNTYINITILVTSEFYGNQHGSSDIISFRQASNIDYFNICKVELNSTRDFYWLKDSTNNRVYLYASVNGGNAYGDWQVTTLSSYNGDFIADYATNQSVSGLTGIGYGGTINHALNDIDGNDIRYKYVNIYNSSQTADSGSLTVNDLANQGCSVGMFYSSTDNPFGSAKWFHALSLAWAKGANEHWVSQLAFGTQESDGLWYRTTMDSIVGAAWKRVIDSDNIGSQNVDSVDGYHFNMDRYRTSVVLHQPTAGQEWGIAIRSSDWDSASQVIQVQSGGNNVASNGCIYTSARTPHYWGYVSEYNGIAFSGIVISVDNATVTHLLIPSYITDVRIYMSFNGSASVESVRNDYTAVYYGFFANYAMIKWLDIISSGSIASGNTRAVTGGAIYDYHNTTPLNPKTGLYVRKSGNVVTIDASITVDSNTVIYTLPSGYRPLSEINANCIVNIYESGTNKYYPGYVVIGTNGEVFAVYLSSVPGVLGYAPSGAQVKFNATWII